MAASYRIRASSGRWQTQRRPLSKENTSPHGVAFSLPGRPLDKLYSPSLIPDIHSADVVQLLQYATDGYGRKIALYIIFLTFVIVCPGPCVLATTANSCSLERLHRVIRNALGSLARGEAVFGYGRWHAPVDDASIPVGDFPYSAAWLSHQRV